MAADSKGGKTLDERVRLIEDRLDIYNLIASHPPSADTGAGDYTASVWTEDGVFDRGAEFPRPTGRAAIAGGSANPEHHRAIEQGIAHFAGLPYVRVTGDTAFAITYLQDPGAGPGRTGVRGGQSRGFRRLSCAPDFGQPLGVRAHRGGLEDPAADIAAARRHCTGARDTARRAGGVTARSVFAPVILYRHPRA